MKQRFSYLDLKLVAKELGREIVGSRVQNIYSLEASPRHFMMKVDVKSSKLFVIIDPGFRIHMTKYRHEPTPQPTGFVAKLRKHLRNARLTNVRVASGSRLLALTFGEGKYYLVFEFFAGGNMILLDETYRILSLFRTVRNQDTCMNCTVGSAYSLKIDWTSRESTPNLETISTWLGKDRLGKVLYSKIFEPSSSMIEYCLRKHNCDPQSKTGNLEDIRAAIEDALIFAHELMDKDTNNGFILQTKDGLFLEFEPFKEYYELELEKNPDYDILQFETYNQAVDRYFGALLDTRQTARLDQLLKLTESRLNAARMERHTRVSGLEQVQLQNERCGLTLEIHHGLVDECIDAVNLLLEQGMDWGNIENLIKMEKERHNEMAQRIVKLEFDKGSMVLRLPADHLEDDSLEFLDISVKLNQTAFANARDYFKIRRAAGAKKEKTIVQADKAFESAESKIRKDLENNLAKASSTTRKLQHIRSTYWFEKFWWFFSANKFLIVAGRDTKQSALLIERCFTTGDLLMHSDFESSSFVLIKNPRKIQIPPQTLSHAAIFCSATCSKAWENRQTVPTWYVTRDDFLEATRQAHKPGEHLSIFEILNATKKNHMMPVAIDVGLGILWQLKDHMVEEPMDGESENDSDESFPDTQFNSDDDSLDSDESPERDNTSSTIPIANDLQEHDDTENKSVSNPEQKLEIANGDSDLAAKVSNSMKLDPGESTASEILNTVPRDHPVSHGGLVSANEPFNAFEMMMPSNLVATPPSDDSQLAAAVPMFAPWACLAKVPLKSRILPGHLKKGKASQELLRRVRNAVETCSSSYMKDLISAIRPDEVQQSIVVSRFQLPIAGSTTTSSKDKNTSSKNKQAKRKTKPNKK